LAGKTELGIIKARAGIAHPEKIRLFSSISFYRVRRAFGKRKSDNVYQMRRVVAKEMREKKAINETRRSSRSFPFPKF